MQFIEDKLIIFRKRLEKLARDMKALGEYKTLIEGMQKQATIYDPKVFEHISPQDRVILDAYLKRFSSVQDFLGAKIWPLLFELVGLPAKAMTEVLYHAVKEGLLNSLETWIEIREIRNELAHDYSDELEDALTRLLTF